jgi:hypothetical protein
MSPESVPQIEYENYGREVWHSDDRSPMKRLPRVLALEDGSFLRLYKCLKCGVECFAGIDAKRYIVVRGVPPTEGHPK